MQHAADANHHHAVMSSNTCTWRTQLCQLHSHASVVLVALLYRQHHCCPSTAAILPTTSIPPPSLLALHRELCCTADSLAMTSYCTELRKQTHKEHTQGPCWGHERHGQVSTRSGIHTQHSSCALHCCSRAAGQLRASPALTAVAAKHRSLQVWWKAHSNTLKS